MLYDNTEVIIRHSVHCIKLWVKIHATGNIDLAKLCPKRTDERHLFVFLHSPNLRLWCDWIFWTKYRYRTQLVVVYQIPAHSVRDKTFLGTWSRLHTY